MKSEIRGSPSFAYVNVDLEPGESVVAESGAMASMAADLDLKARTNGGFFSALGKKFFGGESFFVSEYTNNATETRRLTLTQNYPGDIREIELKGKSICLQPGAYIASTPGLKLGVRWAGFTSWIAREGLFKLVVSGEGRLWFGAYGGLVDREVDGAYIVDTSHLVAYDPQIRLRLQLAGGIFSSFFGGEGLVTRVEGKGRIVMQSRSLDGLVHWTNPKLSG
jgi:uncharacterized protein (TIGR00266 family)